jgi:hypothetical protein
MFSNKFIVIHFGSMVVGYTKAVGNWFIKESGVDFFWVVWYSVCEFIDRSVESCE